MNKLRLVFICFTVCAFTACAQKKEEYKSPSGYDLRQPQVLNMPESLLEISGITFDKGDPSVIYAEQDEEGVLFLFRQREKTVQRIKFGKKGDYEDIAVIDNSIYLLRSDGVIISFRLNSVHQATGVKESPGLLPKGEYEGLYGDEKSRKLYVLCKNCSGDKNKTVTGYVLSAANGQDLTILKPFPVNLDNADGFDPGKKFRLRPSALAQHPASGAWYILSSVNKMLLVTDKEFNIREVFKLKPSLFLQPEGIAFDKQGNLYISNEGGGTKPGTILRFNYKSK